MSIHLWDAMSRRWRAPSGKQFAVSMERQSLADYVRRVRTEKRLSLRDVSIRSGGKIANSHISRIENGESKNVTTEKLRALAKGLEVSEEEVFAVARGVKLISEEDLAEDEEIAALFFNYTKLTEDDKRELRAVIKVLDEEIKRRNLKPKKKR